MEEQEVNMTHPSLEGKEIFRPNAVIGHFPPGVLLFVMGIRLIWASLNSYVQYVITKKEQMLNFPMTAPSQCLRNVPIEIYMVAAVSIVYPCLQFIDFIREVQSSGHFAIHVAIYPLYAVAAICSLLNFYGYRIMEKIDCLFFALSAANEGLLVYSHLDEGWTSINYRLHAIWALLAEANALTFLVEVVYCQSILAALSRSALLSFRGIWLMHIALTQYTQHRNLNVEALKSHNEINLSTGLASLYVSFLISIIFLMSVFLWFKTKDLKLVKVMPSVNNKYVE